MRLFVCSCMCLCVEYHGMRGMEISIGFSCSQGHRHRQRSRHKQRHRHTGDETIKTITHLKREDLHKRKAFCRFLALCCIAIMVLEHINLHTVWWRTTFWLEHVAASGCEARSRSKEREMQARDRQVVQTFIHGRVHACEGLYPSSRDANTEHDCRSTKTAPAIANEVTSKISCSTSSSSKLCLASSLVGTGAPV